MKQPLHGAWLTGSDADGRAVVEDLFESRVVSRRHLAEICDTLETRAGVTETFEDLVLGRFGNDIGESAAAVENFARFGVQRKKWFERGGRSDSFPVLSNAKSRRVVSSLSWFPFFANSFSAFIGFQAGLFC